MPISATTVYGTAGRPDENTTLTVTFDDGSLCNIVFSRVGNPQEYVFIQRGSMSILLWHYTWMQVYKGGTLVKEWRGKPDFGHVAEVQDFMRGYRELRSQFYELRDLAVTSTMMFAARESLESRQTVHIDSAALGHLIAGDPSGSELTWV
jgi:predicted dehydrogenase